MKRCDGPIMDRTCGVWECPDGSHEPSEEDCDRCQSLQDEHADLLAEVYREIEHEYATYGRIR